MTTDLLPVIVDRERAIMPGGFDTWGIKSTRADLRTFGGYQWPWPGQVATATDVDESNTDACPSREGDGLCVATSWRGMASGGIPARTLLLVATRSSDVLGVSVSAGKSRHREVAVVAVVDGERLLREAGADANLTRAVLEGADLAGARLTHANLTYADLRGAVLEGAHLARAHLRGADLARAHLRGADLSYADLVGADLEGADLRGADLEGADLTSADVTGAVADKRTVWPTGFDATAAGVSIR